MHTDTVPMYLYLHYPPTYLPNNIILFEKVGNLKIGNCTYALRTTFVRSFSDCKDLPTVKSFREK